MLTVRNTKYHKLQMTKKQINKTVKIKKKKTINKNNKINKNTNLNQHFKITFKNNLLEHHFSETAFLLLWLIKRVHSFYIDYTVFSLQSSSNKNCQKVLYIYIYIGI